MRLGIVQFKDVRKDLQETWERLKEAGFGWMLPGSRGDGDNSTRRYLNKSHPLGWRNEAKLKLELVQKRSDTYWLWYKDVWSFLFMVWTLF